MDRKKHLQPNLSGEIGGLLERMEELIFTYRQVNVWLGIVHSRTAVYSPDWCRHVFVEKAFIKLYWRLENIGDQPRAKSKQLEIQLSYPKRTACTLGGGWVWRGEDTMIKRRIWSGHKRLILPNKLNPFVGETTSLSQLSILLFQWHLAWSV